MDGMWCNYLQPWLGIAYNPKVMPAAPASWGDIYDAKYKGRIIVPSLQNTEGLANLFMAAFLATGKPMPEAQKDIDAAFKKLVTLKPNLLTAYTQMPQAYNLLEQGEGFMISSAISQVALERKQSGAPVDIAVPKEGIFAMPSGVALVKGAPQPELAAGFINEMIGPEVQAKLSAVTFSLPTNKDTPVPAGMPTGVTVHSSPCWVPPAAARPPCCASSPACWPPTAAPSGSTARTSAPGRRIAATSASSFRTTHCSPTSPSPRMSRSA